jgi:hypothetical protein
LVERRELGERERPIHTTPGALKYGKNVGIVITGGDR